MTYEPFNGQPAMLQIGDIRVRYYLREPSPDKWNAIGVLNDPGEQQRVVSESDCRMIVGIGPTRDEAIGDLIARVLSGAHPLLIRRHIDADQPFSAGARN